MGKREIGMTSRSLATVGELVFPILRAVCFGVCAVLSRDASYASDHGNNRASARA